MNKQEALQKIQELQDYVKGIDAMPEIQVAINNVGNELLGGRYGRLGSITHDDECVKVPLPNGHKAWTFAAFDYVKKFCEAYPSSYPSHSNAKGRDNSEYLYIRFIA